MRISCLAIGVLFVFVCRSGTSCAAEATILIHADKPGADPIPAFITGKFCEHLHANIYNGMDAQILHNPTFADYPFASSQMSSDGIAVFFTDAGQIGDALRRQAHISGWPQAELERLAADRGDGLACWWVRDGEDSVHGSPDVGPHGGRAQRVEIAAAGQGIAQWAYLPLHRTRKYTIEIVARSPDLHALTISLCALGAKEVCARTTVTGLTDQWQKLSGTLEVAASAPADAAYKFAVTADAPGQIVVARSMLRPADAVNGADPDVVHLLRQSHLPLLRWPGGNFVSSYHWTDGVGPAERRPTLPNYAWGGVETNHFGTNEFMAFCQAVGCEPMLCINAGNGTPEEAAAWIEYCNGSPDSPQGRRRAASGHPAPYHVRYVEIGNELWGRWQCHWTTAAGYVDRYQQFRKALLAADPALRLYACGAPAMWGKQWNDTLIHGAGSTLTVITDHPLIGGTVPATTEPLDVFRDFMAVPDVLADKWAGLRRDLVAGGVRAPRLAVTELQMFAHLEGGRQGKLNRRTLVSPGTLAEALYDVLIYHRAARMAPFVEMVTHSATVNHGGGLRKERERVYANPCYYAQSGFAALAGARPVPVIISAGKETAPRVLPELRSATQACSYDAIDALAARATDGSLYLSIVHRGVQEPVRIAVRIEGFSAVGKAELSTLSADVPWASNTLDNPDAICPRESSAEFHDGRLTLDLKPYTWCRVRIAANGP